jgi:hypothetical protein
MIIGPETQLKTFLNPLPVGLTDLLPRSYDFKEFLTHLLAQAFHINKKNTLWSAPVLLKGL